MQLFPQRGIVVLFAALLVLSAIISGVAASGHSQTGPSATVDLYAGQDEPVGTVTVVQNGSLLDVTYTLFPGYAMTESHLSVVNESDDFPVTKKGNPKVGQFEHTSTHDPAVTTYTYIVTPPANDGDIAIAAHAVVESAPVSVVTAPVNASSVEYFRQGTQVDGDPVRTARSDPTNGLEFESGQDETNFVALGFDNTSTTTREGVIIVKFAEPIANGPGDDIRVVEDTWGSSSYPNETAAVYVSQDQTTWYFVGTADNKNDLDADHTVSFFDLGDAGLESAQYVKLVDTTDPADFQSRPNADGYDLNAVQALYVFETGDPIGEETAWADGDRFTDRGNWATWFEYVLSEPVVSQPD